MALAWLGAAVLAGLQSRAAASAGGREWEWSAVFDFAEAGHYTWSAARSAGGSYAEPTMKLALLRAPDATSAALESLEEAVEQLWAAPVPARSGALLSTGSAYELTLDQNNWVSHFQVVVASPGKVAFFAEHLPAEFENGFHFLRTKEGRDVEAVVESPEGGHNHGGHSDAEGHGEGREEHETHCPWSKGWEWAGIFELEAAGTYDWSAARRGGEYADPAMRLLLLPAANATESALQALEHDVRERWEEAFAVVEAGATLSVGNAYTLSFDQLSWVSHFGVSMVAPGAVAFFAQHLPVEFESDFHYFRNASGANVEPAVEESTADCTAEEAAADSDDRDDWAAVIIGSVLTVLPSMLAIGFFAVALLPQLTTTLKGAVAAVSAFSSGVIFAAAIFLLLPEGLHMASSGQDEVTGIWSWGTAIMLGWFLCVVLDHLCQLLFKNRESQEGDGPKGVQWNLAGPVLLGDFFHNLSDGFIVGAAFKSCGASFGWKVVGITVLHEVPQEVADFYVLVVKAGMRPHRAALINFGFGLSSVLGASIAYSADVDTNLEGLILAFGGGVFLYMAITELGPQMVHAATGTDRPSALASLSRLLCFALGAVAIGLVLVDHEHCSPAPEGGEPGAAGAAGGHAHHHH